MRAHRIGAFGLGLERGLTRCIPKMLIKISTNECVLTLLQLLSLENSWQEGALSSILFVFFYRHG